MLFLLVLYKPDHNDSSHFRMNRILHQELNRDLVVKDKGALKALPCKFGNWSCRATVLMIWWNY